MKKIKIMIKMKINSNNNNFWLFKGKDNFQEIIINNNSNNKI